MYKPVNTPPLTGLAPCVTPMRGISTAGGPGIGKPGEFVKFEVTSVDASSRATSRWVSMIGNRRKYSCLSPSTVETSHVIDKNHLKMETLNNIMRQNALVTPT